MGVLGNMKSVSLSPGLTDHDVPLKVGFLGCCISTWNIASKLANRGKISVESIAVTRRSAMSMKKDDKERFSSSLLRVYERPQDVVKQSDIVFCCVQPLQTKQLLESLRLNTELCLLSSVLVRLR